MDGSDNGLSLRKPDTRQYVVASTGTGKTWIACALGNQAAREGFSVLYTRLSRLLDDIATARLGSGAGALMRRIARRELLSPAVSERMDAWMATSVDLSMVASGFQDDPLAHTGSVRNKTGTDDGIRADVGFRGDQAYAVLANFAPGDTAVVMHAMREIGTALS